MVKGAGWRVIAGGRDCGVNGDKAVRLVYLLLDEGFCLKVGFCFGCVVLGDAAQAQ